MDLGSTIYSFAGVMDTAILKSILETLKQKFAERGEEKLFVKKVNSIMIECLQNLIYYADQTHLNIRQPEVKVGSKDDYYIIVASNLIEKDKVESLEKYLNKINAMNKDEQREFYQQVLANGQFNDKGGAGLGFVNIARKTRENKVGFSFEPVNDQYMYFTLYLEV